MVSSSNVAIVECRYRLPPGTEASPGGLDRPMVQIAGQSATAGAASPFDKHDTENKYQFIQLIMWLSSGGKFLALLS
jgi:hypothetical protein